MQKISLILISLLIAAVNSQAAFAQSYSRACGGTGACVPPPLICKSHCDRNYTLFSYYKSYLYAPTYQMITVRISVEPAEFLDVYTPQVQFVPS